MIRFESKYGRVFWVNSLRVLSVTEDEVDGFSEINFGNDDVLVVKGTALDVAARIEARMLGE